MSEITHVGVLTSGGDAPGMNAAIRSAVRTALGRGLKVTGIMRGFSGLIEGDFRSLDACSVSNVIQLGGTILKTSRCEAFYERAGRAEAARKLSDAGIDGLVGIGGDGTFRGLLELSDEHGTLVVGVPGTIDNDIAGTDLTIGFDTAVNTALESIDKIRDTSSSHDRVFFIEVMGRNCGAIALEVGLAGGAEEIAIPEVPPDADRACKTIVDGRKRGKASFIAVVAEGAYPGGAAAYAEKIRETVGLDYRVSILGHVQRGGSPTSFDRAMASRMGRAAVRALANGDSGKMVGLVCNEIELVPLEVATSEKKRVNLELLEVARVTAG